MPNNCSITILIFAVVTILVFVLVRNPSSGYVLLHPSNLEGDEDNKVCRCMPWHHKAIQGDMWGKDVICPSDTLLAGQRYWCTSDSDACVNIACNYIV